MSETEKHPLRVLILGDSAEDADAYRRLLAGGDHAEEAVAGAHQGREA